MKYIATTATALGLAATLSTAASAQDYRVDVFGAAVDDRVQLFDGLGFPTSSELFYGISVDRLDVFMPGLDIGLEYNFMQYNYIGSGTNHLSGNSVFVTASYGVDVSEAFEVYGTAGLGATFANYDALATNGATFDDTVASGYAGIGARYSYDAFSIFAEYRSQSTLEEASFFVAGSDREVNLAENMLLIGFGFSF